jgi:hypothetical protein
MAVAEQLTISVVTSNFRKSSLTKAFTASPLLGACSPADLN